MFFFGCDRHSRTPFKTALSKRFRLCHAERHDIFNDDTSQSSENAIEAQHKLKSYKTFYGQNDRPIQSSFYLETLHAVLHIFIQSID